MKFYLTTPIYYVNDVPHVGHAYTTVAADVLARWHRLCGDDVFFLTGTDEHGAKIAQAAEKNRQSPREFCDHIVAEFAAAWKDLGITNDRFIRTTDPVHEKAVLFFLTRLFESGAIFKSKYEGLYCVHCEKFLSPEDLNEDLCCPDHKQKPVAHAEENYFFKLSGFREKLLEILTDEKHPQHIAVFPVERRNEIIGKLKTGLEDISISRAAVEWGIPLPFDKSQTTYVWVDALLNYISAIGYADNSDEFSKYWPADVHLMAKDILWFHSVIWPALLMAANLPLPRRVHAHGFFTINGDKMSKTLGNIIRPPEMIARFGADPSRYLLLSLIPFGADGDLSWKAMTERYNTDLANNLGNLVSRTLTMIEKYFQGTVPAPAETPRFSIAEDLDKAGEHLTSIEFSRAIEQIQKAIDRANRHIESSAPWKMAKENNPALPTVLFDLLQSIALLSIYLLPFMPNTCRQIWEQLGEGQPLESTAAEYLAARKKGTQPSFLRAGTSIKKGGILFPRIVEK
jgi:methionyl-tRNA synthetase